MHRYFHVSIKYLQTVIYIILKIRVAVFKWDYWRSIPYSFYGLKAILSSFEKKLQEIKWIDNQFYISAKECK
jgi:hypothetical protein